VTGYRTSMRARRVNALRPRYRPKREAWAKAAVATSGPAALAAKREVFQR